MLFIVIFNDLEAEENLSEGSKLSRLYLRTNEGHSVKRRLETNPDDDSPPENQQRTQLRRRTRNPFRSPVRASIQSEQVVSRYNSKEVCGNVFKTQFSQDANVATQQLDYKLDISVTCCGGRLKKTQSTINYLQKLRANILIFLVENCV